MTFLSRRAVRAVLVLSLCACVAGAPGCKRQSKERRALHTEFRQAQRAQDRDAQLRIARRLVEIEPHDGGSWDRLVQAYFALGDLAGVKRALASWRLAVEKPSPKIDECAGDLALAENDPATAIEFWSKVLVTQPKHLRVLEKIARAEGGQRHWKEEIKAWSALIAAQDSATGRINRARACRHAHQWDDALADLHRAQQLAADDPEVVRATRVFENDGKFLGEIREVDARLVLSPQDFGLLGDRALLFLRCEDWELALDDATSAATLAPWAVRPKLFQAIALIGLSRTAEIPALEVDPRIRLEFLRPEFLETTSRLDAEIGAERNNPELYVTRAWQLNDIGQPRLALADAEVALGLDAKSAGALAEAAYALMKLGRGDDAMARARAATEADPNFSTAWQYRGELEMYRNDYLAAVESLTRALSINESATALQKREECYRRLGLLVKAEQDHRAVEELNARALK